MFSRVLKQTSIALYSNWLQNPRHFTAKLDRSWPDRYKETRMSPGAMSPGAILD
jgi:hypothetical protein